MAEKGKEVESRCAACQNLQRPYCVPGCVFARYFPPGDERFAAVREAFDLDALARYLHDQDPDQWAEVTQALVNEAIRRLARTLAAGVQQQIAASTAAGGAVVSRPPWTLAAGVQQIPWWEVNPPRDDSATARFGGVHASFDAEAVVRTLKRLSASARRIPERRLPQQVRSGDSLASAADFEHWADGVFGELLDRPAAADVPGSSTRATAAFPRPAATAPAFLMQQPPPLTSRMRRQMMRVTDRSSTAADVPGSGTGFFMQQLPPQAPTAAADVQDTGLPDVNTSSGSTPEPLCQRDTTEEILLRIPPSTPATRVKAMSVCRMWRNILNDHDFTRRYFDFHAKSLLQGLILNTEDEQEGDLPIVEFVSATEFRPSVIWHRGYRVLDCRHGRVLLVRERESIGQLTVWNPLTGENRPLPLVGRFPGFDGCNAAVLCAGGAGCDHRSCSRGPFLVALARVNNDIAHAWHYSSNTGQWSSRTRLDPDREGYDILEKPAAVAGDAVVFHCDLSTLLVYRMMDRHLSVIDVPFIVMEQSLGLAQIRLLSSDNGDLRLACLFEDTISLWSCDAVAAAWEQTQVISLHELAPFSITLPAHLGAFSDIPNCLFLCGGDGMIFSLSLTNFSTSRVGRINTQVFFFPYYYSF